jgi:hypothetical protein
MLARSKLPADKGLSWPSAVALIIAMSLLGWNIVLFSVFR